ncbi:MAG TPA: MauE/DoxX family redox-associated membrane protein, partial [Polyangia bacterium]|nr:MauE/DoxX family redox-associated membrane protein [Polyangia bacterium]
PWRRAASLAAMGLLVMFTVAIIHVVRAGINVDCGCFGGNTGPVTAWTGARDLALLALAALVFRGTKEYAQ